MAVCRATKRDGSPCTLPAKGSSGYCWAHSPEHAEQRRRQASRAAKSGGRGRPGTEVREIKAALKQLATDVLDKEVDRADAAVASQVYGTYLRALKVELDIREQAEIVERVEELESLLGERKDRRA